MRPSFKLLLLCVFTLFCFHSKSQSSPYPNDIDKICAHIDSVSRSFEEFDFKVNNPHVTMGNRIHYVDTLNKLFKKIVFISELDTLTKTFYYEKDNLIEIKIEKNTPSKQKAKYQFKDYAVSNSWDENSIIRNVPILISEARRYFSFVRYKYK